jgi:hypothetical protein
MTTHRSGEAHDGVPAARREDKEEIIAQAQRLGTFEISIVPGQDSCTLFTPRHPETHAQRYDQSTRPKDAAGRHHGRARSTAVVEQLSSRVERTSVPLR